MTKSVFDARDMQADWFIREVKRCAELGMPLGCCGMWPECSHVLAWDEERQEKGGECPCGCRGSEAIHDQSFGGPYK